MLDLSIAAVRRKATKSYPPETILLLNCHFDRVPLPGEWEEMTQRLGRDLPPNRFRELFFIDACHSECYTVRPHPSAQG
jgi:hypothetical protein